jgi:7-carboxy-7-deazaguanine synthase
MKINEYFASLQGEGKYSGWPCLFIRLSGCTRTKENGLICKFCDTNFHGDGKEYSVDEVIKIITKANKEIVVFTGGEPALQIKEIQKVTSKLRNKNIVFHLESNGDILLNQNELMEFNYIAFSPKDLASMKNVLFMTKNIPLDWYDIKVVTDLKINTSLLNDATMLMPLTTYTQRDFRINRIVWNYCIENNKKFCLRQHVEVWGKKRKV